MRLRETNEFHVESVKRYNIHLHACTDSSDLPANARLGVVPVALQLSTLCSYSNGYACYTHTQTCIHLHRCLFEHPVVKK